MIDVKIDRHIPDALSELFTPEMLETALSDIAEGARAKWIAEARKGLSATKEDYIRGIQPVESKPGTRIIVLVGWLPNAVEKGIDSFDMRSTVLGPNSRIRRESKDGNYYGYVPFRHKTPSATTMGGQPMGRPYGPRSEMYAGTIDTGMSKGESAQLGKDIYKHAKGLSATSTRISTYYAMTGPLPRSPQTVSKTKWGARLPAGLAPILRPPDPTHKDKRMRRGHVTDIYSGMVRIRHKYEKATQTQYMTWRTISTRVKDGWIHPGIRARNFSDEVERYVHLIAKSALKNILKNALAS